jgi:hypothetical protein
VVERVSRLLRPVGADHYLCLALGGGIHRHQAQLEGMVDHDPGCAEVALDRVRFQRLFVHWLVSVP